MAKRPLTSAVALVPSRPTLGSVREAARTCRAGDLWKGGTQTVFGEGAKKRALMLAF